MKKVDDAKECIACQLVILDTSPLPTFLDSWGLHRFSRQIIAGEGLIVKIFNHKGLRLPKLMKS
jgi:hypothetical protein